MQMTFGDIYNSILFAMGLTTDTVEANIATEIKRRINIVQSFIWYNRNWDWRRQRFYLTTKPPYATGTITVVQGSRSVAGSGTVWTNEHKLAYLRTSAEKLYKVSDETISDTALKIRAGMPESGVTASTYKLVFPDYVLENDISSLINIKYRGKDIRLVSPEKMVRENLAMGAPEEASIRGLTDYNFYTTGTVGATLNSTTIVGSGTQFVSYMEGMTIRVDEFSEPYTIKSVTDGEHLEIRDPYQGDTGSGKSYKINPKGLAILTLANIPDDYYWLEMEALIRPKRLVNNNDISLIPNHAPLLHGAIWFAMADLQNKNPVRVQQARADFERTLKELIDTYKVVNGIQWTSESELQYRKNGIGTYDPFSR